MNIERAKGEEIIDLRHRVLRAGLPRETAIFDGDDLPTTKHFKAVDNDKVIGCATMLLNEWQGQTAYQVRGMAVDEDLRSHGVGSALLQAMENAATESPLLWCDARTPAVDFYRKNGWSLASDEFIIHGIPHYKMFKRL